MITQQEEIERVQEAYDIEKEELDELRARFEKLSCRTPHHLQTLHSTPALTTRKRQFH